MCNQLPLFSEHLEIVVQLCSDVWLKRDTDLFLCCLWLSSVTLFPSSTWFWKVTWYFFQLWKTDADRGSVCYESPLKHRIYWGYNALPSPQIQQFKNGKILFTFLNPEDILLEIIFKIIKEGGKIHLGEMCMIKTSTGEIKGVLQKSMNKPKDGANIELVHCLIFVLYMNSKMRSFFLVFNFPFWSIIVTHKGSVAFLWGLSFDLIYRYRQKVAGTQISTKSPNTSSQMINKYLHGLVWYSLLTFNK